MYRKTDQLTSLNFSACLECSLEVSQPLPLELKPAGQISHIPVFLSQNILFAKNYRQIIVSKTSDWFK